MNYRKIILILFLGIFLSAERNAKAQVHTLTFNYTGSLQTFVVPSCVAYITVVANGAQGGGTAGGTGAKITGTLSVTPGNTLDIVVGQQGANGDGTQNGSGGGGTYIWNSSSTTLMIAAAGGGGYSSNGGSPAGQGSGTTTPTTVGGSGCGAGGSGGNGGVYGAGNNSYAVGGGGSGWLSNGGTNPGIYNEGVGGGGFFPLSIITPSAGGAAGSQGATGGYGGGGGSSGGSGASGGGGGYNGGGGGDSYNAGWGSGGGGGSFNGGTNQTNVTGFNSGNGKLTITYSTDSVGSASATIISNIVCNGANAGVASVLVNGVPGGGAFTYSWTPNGATTDTATGLVAGVYTVTVTGCGSASATVTITQPGFFAPAPVISNILCNGGTGSITAGATGGTLPYTYVFTPGGNVPAIYNLAAGTYSLNILDNRGCATSDLISLTQPNVLSTTTSMVTAPNCYGGNGGSLLANVNGGTYPFNYAWSPAGGSSAAASGLSGGTYTLTVTDNNGCTESVPATVSQPAYLGVAVNPPLFNLACNGDNNGVLGSGVEGGIRPYTYAWSGARGSDSDAMNLSAGTYSLTVTDAHGCVTVVSATVNQPPAMNLTINSTLDNGSCSASAWVVLSGATPPYNYLWSNFSTAFHQDSLCKGKYCCRVTDANGCIYDVCTNIESDLGVGNVSGNSDKITVYPNPNNGTFTVASTVDGGNSVLEVYNVLGEKVYSSTLNASKGENNSINMGAQTNGIYLYRVMTVGGNLLGEGKIVLQK